AMLHSDPLGRVKRLQRRAESGASRGLALLVSQIGATGRDAVARLRPVPQTSTELAVPASRPAPIEPDPVGMEDPRDVAATIPLVERAFVFLDLCGFTGFIPVHAEPPALDALRPFPPPTPALPPRPAPPAAPRLG